MRLILNCKSDGSAGQIRVMYLGSIVKYRIDRCAAGYLLIAIDELGQENVITKTAFDTEALALITAMETAMENGEDQMDLRIGATSFR